MVRTLADVIRAMTPHHAHNVMELSIRGEGNLNLSEGVRDAVLEALDYNSGEWDDDAAHEIADSQVPVYTSDVFREAGLIGAVASVDMSEFGPFDDIESGLKMALYEVYRTAVYLLVEYARDEIESDEPEIIHTACGRCGLDIEGTPGESDWRDRGNNSHCRNGAAHVPAESGE